MMNKKMTREILAGILALFVATAVLTPAMTSVYAAGSSEPQHQKPAPTPKKPEPSKDGGTPHSGHH